MRLKRTPPPFQQLIGFAIIQNIVWYYCACLCVHVSISPAKTKDA